MREDLLDGAVIAELRGNIAAETLLEVIEIFEVDAPKRMTEISAAARAGDTRALTEAAHSLKGSSSSLGAVHLAQVSARLEKLTHADLEHAPALAHELERAVRDTSAALRRELTR